MLKTNQEEETLVSQILDVTFTQFTGAWELNDPFKLAPNRAGALYIHSIKAEITSKA
ncbi:hypothetical protein YC2023_112506 [Brassica napus]